MPAATRRHRSALDDQSQRRQAMWTAVGLGFGVPALFGLARDGGFGLVFMVLFFGGPAGTLASLLIGIGHPVRGRAWIRASVVVGVGALGLLVGISSANSCEPNPSDDPYFGGAFDCLDEAISGALIASIGVMLVWAAVATAVGALFLPREALPGDDGFRSTHPTRGPAGMTDAEYEAYRSSQRHG